MNSELTKKDVAPYLGYRTTGGNGWRLIGTYDYSSASGDVMPLYMMKVKQGHGNGVSYLYYGEYIFGVSTGGEVTCTAILKKTDGTYGRFGYRLDTANKILYLYIYSGQYSVAYFSDVVKINNVASNFFTLASDISSVTSDSVTLGNNVMYPSDKGDLTLASTAYVDNKAQISAPVGSIIAMPKDTWPAGYLGCWSDAGINSEGYFANLWNDDYGYVGLDLYNYLGTTWGTFTKDGKTYRRLPGYNTNSAFLRGGGGKGAAIGTLQQDAAPNITAVIRPLRGGWSVITPGRQMSDGAIEVIMGNNSWLGQWSAGDSGGYVSANCQLDFNASRSSAAYGRDNTTEVRPVNYAVFYFIKY
jgi:hypothetical protein